MDSFEPREGDLPEPQHEGLLVRVQCLPVDPYMCDRVQDVESYVKPWSIDDPMQGTVVSEVAESGSDVYDVDDLVSGNGTWTDYIVLDAGNAVPVDPSIVDLPAYPGVLRMPGRTMYSGLPEVGDPSSDETVAVPGTASAVGSVVGQITKFDDCRVVGFADSDEKVSWLTGDSSFDAAINYKAVGNHRTALDDAVPGGVDVYSDNVGGPITGAAFMKLNLDACVTVCGRIVHYNDEGMPTSSRKLPQLIVPRAKVQRLLVSGYATRFGRASGQLGPWVASDDLEHRETVVDGLKNTPDAFLGLSSGDSIGEQVVGVSGPQPDTSAGGGGVLIDSRTRIVVSLSPRPD